MLQNMLLNILSCLIFSEGIQKWEDEKDVNTEEPNAEHVERKGDKHGLEH